MDYLVLLYYCYTPIADPEAFREEHHRLCLRLNLLGRIIVAGEGLNGTVSGRRADCEEYMRVVKADSRFVALEFKVEEAPAHTFQKLHVRVKPEIVHVGLPHVKPYERTGTHLSPQEFRQLKDQPDVVVLDVRSDYEHRLGRFKNAVTLDIENFREFPDKVQELEQYRGKKILTYCTGGIKCEKASAFLLEQGFEDVYQLHGGIIKYGLEAGGEDFEGKCYVFDGRVAVDVNRVNPTVISYCHHCHTPSSRMVNCANPHCNAHVPLCEACGQQLDGACSTTCQQHPDKRPYDGTGTYPKNSNHYNPEQGLLSYRAPAR
ncbi:oxygen-dependent tRNA uridine(34) hydroxylase TrhO [Hymenobacter weizhouensis]|uniref:oxygen-dependent tRNA uridine(34) hydroxylase TrhO n=1 Tax=Hymenobacter sp. YIM 151500-1 TaxID=2987689 RepID=UPI0022279F70|nr:rhodanese-related sulfurtransferase [Hymenobacter sp. YIM 151500-1]UYZ64324.1 rhodanese-related sulfurtransferase [Hymenobacter sp. YIM 151500-1]